MPVYTVLIGGTNTEGPENRGPLTAVAQH